MDNILTFALPLLPVFLVVFVLWFVYRAFLALLRRTPSTKGQDVGFPKKEGTTINPFIPDADHKEEQPTIVVQVPIPKKKEFFVMRADNKKSDIYEGDL